MQSACQQSQPHGKKFSVKSSQHRLSPGYETAVTPPRNRCLEGREASQLQCSVSFPGPARVRAWTFSFILYSLVCLIACLKSQTTDLTWFWPTLFLDLDLNSSHHKYPLVVYLWNPPKCQWLLPSFPAVGLSSTSDSVTTVGVAIHPSCTQVHTPDQLRQRAWLRQRSRQMLPTDSVWDTMRPLSVVSVALPSLLGQLGFLF